MTTTSPASPGREYWLIWSTPNSGVAAEEFDAILDEHLAWTRRLEEEGAVLCSGPLLSGPGTRPGAGMTVLRAADEQAASDLASQDPFVRHGLRGFALHRWQLKEGAIDVRVHVSTGTYEWK